jgi:PAS domain S-box-containing protein
MQSVYKDGFAENIQALGRRLEELQQQTRQSPASVGESLLEALTELQNSLEELQVAEEELRQQSEELIASRRNLEVEHQRYRDLFEFAPDGYLVTDDVGIIKEANREAVALLQVAPGFLAGKPLTIFVAAEDRPALYRQLVQLSQGEEVHDWEVRLQPRARNPVSALVTAVAIHDQYGATVGLRWLLHDNTARKQAEERLRVLNATLEKQVEQRTARLRQSNEELQQFAYTASHDLQEPLRMVKSYVELLAERYRGKLDPEADEFINYAIEGATRMQGLIRDLLHYSRVDTQRKEFAQVNCTALLGQILRTLQQTIAESGASVTADPLPTVLADESQLGQVFQNLISNALKFRGPDAPRIHIAAELRDKEWLFAVRDNGIGIDAKFAERIFVIFQRLHARREYPGTGLGLAICKKIIENHDGRIWVESKLGQGATFYFTLPTTQE